MKSLIKLFLILVTTVTILFTWMTGQLSSPRMRIVIAVLAALTLAVFLVFNLLDHRKEQLERKRRESKRQKPTGTRQKRSGTRIQFGERKSGLTWGGGNIKASEATRGTKRKFLGQ